MPGIHNKIGFGQTDIDIFSVPAKNKLANRRKELAASGQKLTLNLLVRDVSVAWTRALLAKKEWMLFRQLDSLYANFERAAALRFKTQHTSRIEYLSASAKYKELLVNKRTAESRYQAALQILNQYIMYPGEFDVAGDEWQPEIPVQQVIADSLKSSSLLGFYQLQTLIAESEWKNQKARFLPKIDLGYALQSVDGQSGFNMWQAGISFPLVFNVQNGKAKAARFNYEIVEQNYTQKQLELNAMYNERMRRFIALAEVLDYYNKEALPLAEEQMDAAALAYRLGSIDYIQFIQNMEAAIRTKQDFLKQQAAYFELAAELKYLSEK